MNEEFKQFIKDLKLIHNIDCFVAGGAPLAIFLKQEYKDIDIFIKTSDLSVLRQEKDGMQLLNYFFTKEKGNTYTVLPNNLFRGNIGGKVVDLIVIPDEIKQVEDLIYCFDFDICKVWLDTESWSVHMLDEAYQSLKSKKIHYLSGDNVNSHFNKTAKNKENRIKRYKEKFPDYTVWEQLL